MGKIYLRVGKSALNLTHELIHKKKKSEMKMKIEKKIKENFKFHLPLKCAVL